MLPLIRKGALLNGPLRDMDARIDVQVETINQALKSVSRSKSDENRKALTEFEQVLDTTTRIVTIITIIVLFAILLASILIMRWIIHPLSELTSAVRIMETGNFKFNLKRRSDDEISLLV